MRIEVVTRVTPDSNCPWDRVHSVGGPGWTKSEDAVIAEIKQGHSYVTPAHAPPVKLVIGEREGSEYLCLDPEVTERSLLTLPKCPHRLPKWERRS